MIILKYMYHCLNSILEWRSAADSKEIRGVEIGGGCHF